MRFIMGMIAVVALLLLAVVFVGVMALNPSTPTPGMVALMPLEQSYEKATRTLLPQVAVAVVVTFMAVGMYLVIDRALRSSDYRIQPISRGGIDLKISDRLKFPHVHGHGYTADDKSR